VRNTRRTLGQTVSDAEASVQRVQRSKSVGRWPSTIERSMLSDISRDANEGFAM